MLCPGMTVWSRRGVLRQGMIWSYLVIETNKISTEMIFNLQCSVQYYQFSYHKTIMLDVNKLIIYVVHIIIIEYILLTCNLQF